MTRYQALVDTLPVSTDQRPLASFVVTATVDSSVEISRDNLAAIVAGTDFANFHAPSPEPRTIVRRAIAALVKELIKQTGDQKAAKAKFFNVEREAVGKTLIREIKEGGDDVLWFGFVAETVQDYGLEYLQGFRVFCSISSYQKLDHNNQPIPKLDNKGRQKKLNGQLLWEMESEINLGLTGVTTESKGYTVSNQTDPTLTASLKTKILYYLTHYKSAEINRMLKDMLDSLSPANLSPRGGVYTVFYNHDHPTFRENRRRIGELKGIVQEIGKHATGEASDEEFSTDLVAIPVYDDPYSRSVLQASTKETLMQQVKALQAEFERFKTRRDDDPARVPTIHEDAMKQRLERYEDLRKKLALYQSFIELETQDITATLAQLEEEANGMLAAYMQHKAQEAMQKRAAKKGTQTTATV